MRISKVMEGRGLSPSDFEKDGVFGSRYIAPWVVEARPYFRYKEREMKVVLEADSNYRDLGNQYRSVVSIVNQEPGTVMVRHAVPLDEVELDPIFAELRPDRPVVILRKPHTHPAPQSPKYLDQREGWDNHFSAADDGKKVKVLGRTRTGKLKAVRAQRPHKNETKPHIHPNTPKYVFPPTPYMEVVARSIETKDGVRRIPSDVPVGSRIIRFMEDDSDVDGIGGTSGARYRKKDWSKSRAKRLDIHPEAKELLEKAKAESARVFFALEGCLKADSLLSAGEAVFSVPSVTLWSAKELELFAQQWLPGATVFVLTDSDWHNPDVAMQGLLCRDALREMGVDAYFAAPPSDHQRKNGVDDFLQGGGKVDDIQVVHREPPPGLAKWVRQQSWTRKDGQRRNADVLQWITVHADKKNRVQVPSTTIGRHTGHDPRSAGKAVVALVEAGALEPDEELYQGWNWYTGKPEWVPPRAYRVAPNLRAKTTISTVGAVTKERK